MTAMIAAACSTNQWTMTVAFVAFLMLIGFVVWCLGR